MPQGASAHDPARRALVCSALSSCGSHTLRCAQPSAHSALSKVMHTIFDELWVDTRPSILFTHFNVKLKDGSGATLAECHVKALHRSSLKHSASHCSAHATSPSTISALVASSATFHTAFVPTIRGENADGVNPGSACSRTCVA